MPVLVSVHACQRFSYCRTDVMMLPATVDTFHAAPVMSQLMMHSTKPVASIAVVMVELRVPHSWPLPAPENVAMASVNMRHTLTWRPLASLCDTAALYTVQFQGEFEQIILNDTWLDAPRCQRTPHTHCDLTSDLGSDSDYGVRVRAECGRRVSPWVRLGGLFNRRDTLLSPPEMAVAVMGDGLLLSFEHLPPTSSVNITMWRQGREDEESWKKLTAATVTLVVMVALLFAVFWSVGRCEAEGCHAHFQKEPLPFGLEPDWPTERRACPEQVEICEPIADLLLVELT
ncbi:hypothetical protein CRUP_014052 [Coryphaenoides rupestris]|nr:hypothetical protein CRUP_014052 [Coryphaenoides rupestris]